MAVRHPLIQRSLATRQLLPHGYSAARSRPLQLEPPTRGVWRASFCSAILFGQRPGSARLGASLVRTMRHTLLAATFGGTLLASRLPSGSLDTGLPSR